MSTITPNDPDAPPMTAYHKSSLNFEVTLFCGEDTETSDPSASIMSNAAT